MEVPCPSGPPARASWLPCPRTPHVLCIVKGIAVVTGAPSLWRGHRAASAEGPSALLLVPVLTALPQPAPRSAFPVTALQAPPPMSRFLAEGSLCGRGLLELVARGSAIIAELLRLAEHIPGACVCRGGWAWGCCSPLGPLPLAPLGVRPAPLCLPFWLKMRCVCVGVLGGVSCALLSLRMPWAAARRRHASGCGRPAADQVPQRAVRLQVCWRGGY